MSGQQPGINQFVNSFNDSRARAYSKNRQLLNNDIVGNPKICSGFGLQFHTLIGMRILLYEIEYGHIHNIQVQPGVYNGQLVYCNCVLHTFKKNSRRLGHDAPNTGNRIAKG